MGVGVGPEDGGILEDGGLVGLGRTRVGNVGNGCIAGGVGVDKCCKYCSGNCETN